MTSEMRNDEQQKYDSMGSFQQGRDKKRGGKKEKANMFVMCFWTEAHDSHLQHLR